MLVSDLGDRLVGIADFLANYAPPDVRIAGLQLNNDKNKFVVSFDMAQNVPLAERYREIVADKLVEQNIDFRFGETGRRLQNRSADGGRPLDNMSSYIFETEKWVLKLVNFSNYAAAIAATPPGPGESADDNIEEEGATDGEE